jgi:thioesterase domain-containing protein/acyl carrier protein
LLEQIRHEALTVMDLPTAYWHQVAQEEMSEAAASLAAPLRLVTVGGERLLPAPLQRWRQTPLGLVQLLNAYGPTETTITATLYDTAGYTEGSSSLESIPIGRPLPNRRIYILDRAGQPVPLGIAGELSIGGDMLACGYLNRPELTAECFVPDPFSRQPGARLYRTGDVVRYRPGGNLQFLGRIDHQVKIRGFRIELGEIECTLNAHPGVRESVVIAREDSPGDPRLVAYIVFHPEQTSNTEQLWTYLQEHLPDYMLPAQLIVLDALPLNTNGKVDRHALLARRPEEGEQQPHERQQPRDRIELQLLRIWERVLEREPISLTDNFFRQGGHSLAALRLHARIQNEFQRQLPLGLLFQYPTIRELAQILRQETGYVRGSALVPLQPHGSRAPFFCVHPGGGSVFCYLDLVRYLGMSYPVYGLQVPELEEEQAIASVEQLAAHYIAALQTVQPEGPYLLGGWSAGGIIAYEMASQLRYQGHDVALLCLFDSPVPSGQRTQEHKQGSTLIKEFLVEWGFDEQKVSCLTEEEQLRVAYDVFKRELMLPDGLDLAYVQRFIHIQYDISTAVEAYEPPRSDQRIVLIRVEQEREQASGAAQDGREPECDSTYGWSAVTMARVDVHSVPGTHNEMFREPYVQTVASTLQACLDERGKHQESIIS